MAPPATAEGGGVAHLEPGRENRLPAAREGGCRVQVCQPERMGALIQGQPYRWPHRLHDLRRGVTLTALLEAQWSALTPAGTVSSSRRSLFTLGCRRRAGLPRARWFSAGPVRREGDADSVLRLLRPEGGRGAGSTAATAAAAERRDRVNGQRAAAADTEWNARVLRRTSATVVADSDRWRASVASWYT